MASALRSFFCPSFFASYLAFIIPYRAIARGRAGMTSNDYDVVIIGGGFYGCCLALFLRSVTPRILVVEAGTGLLERASRVNQARIHAGFHYPRSFTTAMRSRALQERFARDFKHAVVADFDMLYAIAAYRSKVSSSRFARM